MEETVIVRKAKLEDFNNIQQFIRTYWDDGSHIFAHNTQYFQYYCVIDNELLFVLGEGEKSKEIYGICGYVCTNRCKSTDIQLILLRVLDNHNRFTSIHLIKFIENNLNARVISSCGVRSNVTVLYDFLGYKTGKLNHFYRIADKKEYIVSVISQKRIPPANQGEYRLKHIDTFEKLKNIFHFERYKEQHPYKDDWCIKHRYYDSLIHKYKVYLIDKGTDKFDSLLAMREIDINGTKICKIVDFVGIDEDIAGLSSEFNTMMGKNGYEYIEFYNLGISYDIMETAGFILRTEEDPNIIPRLFEPFVQSNKDINYFVNDFSDIHMYCGDADQDRANIG